MASQGSVRVIQPLQSIDDLLALLARGAGARDEPELDVLSHSLQTAAILATEHPGAEELIAAGLVHDIADAATPDDHRDHDRRSAELVGELLGPYVAKLVGAHVLAKRYLVTAEPQYRATLSFRSVETLLQQGNDLADRELAALTADPDFGAIVTLRRADERAKVRDAPVATLESWRPLLERVAAT